MKNMFTMMKEAASMKKNMKKIQDGLRKQTVEYSVPNGKITVTARGDATVSGIKIDPSIVDPANVKELEKLVLKAVEGALEEAKRLSAAEMSKLVGDMGLPKIPGLGL